MEIQRLPGFRDFYPEDCAFRNYVFETWRDVARRFGFQEYDGPILESTELYKRKSGEELKTQLFRFTDQGGRDVCLRPEMTPTVARLVAARAREFRKPLKWFSIGAFARFERPQKGRSREFYQVNCDIFGDRSPAADAELVALAVAMLRAFGLTADDFSVRLNDRNLWSEFYATQHGATDHLSEFLAIIDKWEREPEAVIEKRLAALGLKLTNVAQFLKTSPESIPGFEPLWRELGWRGLEDFVELDLRVVRGLDYYTGLVFELFDRKRENRSIAGGGRYDNLVSAISDGAVDLPAAGFAIGDLVLSNLLVELEHTHAQADAVIRQKALSTYVIIAEENRRAEALELVSFLRQNGVFVDYSLHSVKIGKQFELAEALGARFIVVVGKEWPQVRFRRLADRNESLQSLQELPSKIREEQ
jgi:histidyl-tRNA synthetase